MPYKDKEQYREYQRIWHRNWYAKHKDRCNAESKKYRITHKDYCNTYSREYNLFHGRTKARLGRIEAILKLGGCCVFCFETNFYKLETHHPFGRIKYPEIMIQICLSCHGKIDGRIKNVMD